MPRNYLSSSAPEHSLHSLVEKWIQPAEKSHYRCLRGAAIPTGSRIQYWRARALLCPRAHHLLPLRLTTNFRRADNFCAPNKVTGHCHYHCYRTRLPPLCDIRLVSPGSAALRAGVGLSVHHPFLPSAFETATQGPQQPERTHDAGTASLAHPPESIPSSYRPKLVIPEKRVVQSLNFCA